VSPTLHHSYHVSVKIALTHTNTRTESSGHDAVRRAHLVGRQGDLMSVSRVSTGAHQTTLWTPQRHGFDDPLTIDTPLRYAVFRPTPNSCATQRRVGLSFPPHPVVPMTHEGTDRTLHKD